MDVVTAAEIARTHGIDPKRYRQALRDARFHWYVRDASWTVPTGSSQHEDMLRVLQSLVKRRPSGRSAAHKSKASVSPPRDNDEAYIIDLCDEVLGERAVRQHGFDFLRGDAGRSVRGRMLPVDAWYPELGLVIEYRERQHSETVAFFDRRATVSGVGRGEQRRLYDQRRRDILPQHEIELVEFDYFEFDHTSNRRLVRSDSDRQTVTRKLKRFVT